jgi:hypothetical protein
MRSSKQLFDASAELGVMASATKCEIVREALNAARARVTIEAATQLQHEIDMAKLVLAVRDELRKPL